MGIPVSVQSIEYWYLNVYYNDISSVTEFNTFFVILLFWHCWKIPNLICEFEGYVAHVSYETGADCKVSNTRMIQGQSFEGGTFVGQLVRWSVKIVQELPSFSLKKRRGGQLFPLSGSLSQRIT